MSDIDMSPDLCERCARGSVRFGDEIAFEAPHRLAEHHVAVRFPGKDHWGFVELDGEDTKNCVEAIAGRSGFALLIMKYPADCWTCGRFTRSAYRVYSGQVAYQRVLT